LLVVFSGSIGRCGVGGLAWMNMQYLAGLRALGHDVYYIEECGPESWVYDWEAERLTTDIAYPAGYVADCLDPLGLTERWAYRAGNECAGMPAEEVQEVCTRADLMIIHAVPLAQWRPEYERARRRTFVDVDPGFTQICLAKGDKALNTTVDRCDRLFTIGQRLGAVDCPAPTAGRQWLKALPPVALPLWPVAADGPATHFTSVMQWRGFRDVTYDGVVYGQKDREFPAFVDLPRQTPQPFRIALTGAPPDDLTRNGWEVVPGHVPSRTPWSYQEFIRASRAEFTVAKHGYVRMRGGWFSDRSVCYLASGRPVLVQDTGLADWLPVGEGVVTFRDVSEAIRGVEAINADYDSHRRAARRLAEEVFAADRVLPPMVTAAAD
jgi:hypothetical protein